MIRLIATDLDGTIINHANQCSERVAEMVRSLHERGIKFAVCSGRPVDSYVDMLEQWGLKGITDYAIGSNGGEVLDLKTGEKHEALTLDADTVRDIMNQYRPLGLVPTVYAGTTLYVERMTDQVGVLCRRVGVTPVVVDLETVLTGPQTKEMFVLEPEKMEMAEAFAASHPDPRWTAYKTAVDLLEFTHPQLNKSVGMATLKKLLNLKEEEMMAFGDTTNDIPMLQSVKYGICMANGSDDTKAAAYELAPSVSEDGFVCYLEKHLPGTEYID